MVGPDGFFLTTDFSKVSVNEASFLKRILKSKFIIFVIFSFTQFKIYVHATEEFLCILYSNSLEYCTGIKDICCGFLILKMCF